MLVNVIIQSLPGILTALAVAFVLTVAYRRIAYNQKTYRLGGRAPIVPSKFLGVDEILAVLKYAENHKNVEFWTERFLGLKSWTIETGALGNRIILTAEPENIKTILATSFYDFGKGQDFHDAWKEFLGDSIFTTDGKEWHSSRQLIRPQFIKDRVSDLHTFERHVQYMISLIPRDGSTVDVADLFFRVTLDTATDFLLGNSVNSLATTDNEFAAAFAECQVYMNNVTRVGPFRRFLSKKSFNRNIRVINAFVEPFVKRTLEMRDDELKGKNESDYNFLHALAQFTRDPVMLRDQLVAVLLAARDTTAGTLCWIFLHLSRSPEVVRKLREEILKTIGPTAAPTYSDLKGMKYLQHIMDETLRLYPAVPFNIRMSLKDTFLPLGAGEGGLSPVGVPQGTPVAYSTLVMQRRKDLFGEDAEEWKPERWENWTPKPWHYVPFNGGPRICVGQQFALTEMSYMIVRIFQTFETIESHDMEPPIERCEITISPLRGVKVGMRPARI